MTDDRTLDVAAQIPLLVGVQSAVNTAVGGPMLQGLATQVQAVLLSAAAAPLRDQPATQGEWFAVKGDDHLIIAGPELTITATLSGIGVQSARVDTAGRSLQCDFGDPSSRVTTTGLLEAAGGGIGAVVDRVKDAAAGQVRGALGRIRVRVSEGTSTIADWTFEPGGVPVDNRDSEGQIARAEAEFEGDLARAGTPGETPNTDPTELVASDGAGGALTGVVGAAATTAAMAATQRLVRRAMEARRQPDAPAATPEPSLPAEPTPTVPVHKEAIPIPSSPKRDESFSVAAHHCESCNGPLDQEDLFCPACGTAVVTLQPEPTTATCATCQSDLDEGARFCASCGTPVESTVSVLDGTEVEHEVQEWCYVTAPVATRSVANTNQSAGWLQPGTWYLANQETEGWVLVKDPDTGLEGWAPAVEVQYPRQEPDQTLELPGPSNWVGSHAIAATGVPAWAEPDPSKAPVANLDGGLEVDIVERRGDWARVRASNQWEGWVDGRQLVERSRKTPGSTSPASAAGTSPRDVVLISGALAVLASAFIPWAAGGTNALDIPAAFLVEVSTASTAFSIGILVLVLGAAGLGVAFLDPMRRYRRVVGVLAIVVALAFFVQSIRLLADVASDGENGTLVDLLLDTLRVGGLIALAGGIAIAMKK